MLPLLVALVGCAHHPASSVVTPSSTEATPAADAAAPATPAALSIAGVPAPLVGGPLTEVPAVPAGEAEAKLLYLSARDRIDALDFAGAKQALAELASRYPTTEAAITGARLATQIAVVGQPAPPLDVATWLQGQASIPPKGAVLLVFFESWCPHCVNEAPHLTDVAAAWASRGLQVVALTRLTRSSTPESVTALAASAGWTFPVGVERDGAVTTAYGGSGVPSAAVIVDGTVVWRGHPARLSDDVLAALLR